MARNDKRQLIKALREAGASELQWRMAAILWRVNGIDNALEYVAGLVEKGLAGYPISLEGLPLFEGVV